MISKSTTVVEDVSLNWLIFSFHIMSFVFQMLVLIPQYRYEQMVEQRGQNCWGSRVFHLRLVDALLYCPNDRYPWFRHHTIDMPKHHHAGIGSLQWVHRDSRIRTGSFTLAWFSNLAAYGIIFGTLSAEQTELKCPGLWSVSSLVNSLYLTFLGWSSGSRYMVQNGKSLEQ